MTNKVDPERLKKLISSTRASVRILREIENMPESEFNKDIHRQGSAKYNFIASIEAAIDIAHHLISKRGFRAPNDYADTFKVLADSGVLERDFASELEKMALFRNRLVHIYWDVDVVEIWKILQTRLGDFEKYISQVGKYLANSRDYEDLNILRKAKQKKGASPTITLKAAKKRLDLDW
jgi:uncharacterized protein YutE (UPF0331/DUF86 family)